MPRCRLRWDGNWGGWKKPATRRDLGKFSKFFGPEESEICCSIVYLGAPVGFTIRRPSTSSAPRKSSHDTIRVQVPRLRELIPVSPVRDLEFLALPCFHYHFLLSRIHFGCAFAPSRASPGTVKPTAQAVETSLETSKLGLSRASSQTLDQN